ncbi:MAG: hypothetical protein KGP28_02740 [Bdellovibrionales bacterium]|nr:hypothetical protein [Bdellovibrionales bacterium]
MQLNRIRLGMNFWQAIVWESSLDPEDEKRLESSLSQFKAMGIGFVRILASTQKISSPFSIRPAMETGGEGDEERSARVLLRLLDRLERHEIQAIIVLGNFWSWSGGFPAYAEWSGQAPFPRIGPDSSLLQMARFFLRASRVYSDAKVNLRYRNLVNAILETVPARHSAIFCYQLANEPTPLFNSGDLSSWAEEHTRLIRFRNPGAPVSLGGIGTGPLPFGTKTDLRKIYRLCNFDFLTVHIWPQNWGWYDPKNPRKTLESTLIKTRKYLALHGRISKELGIPLLLEEINLARDLGSLDPESSTNNRDLYLQFVHEELGNMSKSGVSIAGIAYWTWESDPPHEPRGWYAIHPTDQSTIGMIKKFSSPT